MKYTFYIIILALLSFTEIDAQIVGIRSHKNKVGFVDRNGKWIITPIYSSAKWNNLQKIGIFTETGSNKYGVVNESGAVIIPCEYDEIHEGSFDEYQPYVYVSNKIKGITYTGLFNKNGANIVPCSFVEVLAYKNGVTVKDINGKYGVIGYNGQNILDVKYSNFICLDSEREYNISLNIGGTGNEYRPDGGKWGICNNLGVIIIPCEYDAIKLVTNDVYTVCLDGKWGLWASGKEIFSCIYDEAITIQDGVARTKKDGEIRLIKDPIKYSNIALGNNTSIKIGDNKVEKRNKVRNVISRYPSPNSDVDINIPKTQNINDKTFAFIFANENYPTAPVPYSLNDGRMFKVYCNMALGIPNKNIYMYEDATFGDIVSAIERMKKIADVYDGDANIFFYYAGHGFPEENQQTAYLLPIDGNVSDIITTGYSLAQLYKELASLNLKQSIVFIDACFSGTKREDVMLSKSRGVAIKVKQDYPTGKILVFAASQGDETAHQIEEKHHGLFTYYLLKGMQLFRENIKLGDLSEYVIKNVKRQSVVINNKKQTPTVIPSTTITNNWRNIVIGN